MFVIRVVGVHAAAIQSPKGHVQRLLIRQTDRHGRRFHPRQFAHLCQAPVKEPIHLLGSGVTRILHRELGREHVICIESRMEAAQKSKRADQ
jgi:hypothetical protein